MARILVAEDSELLRKLLAAALGSHSGWTVCGTAANGLSAVLKAHELKPDLVILDLVMPMLDGLQAAAEIAKNHPAIPIVIYSVQILPELEMEAKKYGVWAMVSKSADHRLLIETIERLLDSSRPQVSVDTIESPIEVSPSGRSTTASGGDGSLDRLPDSSSEPD